MSKTKPDSADYTNMSGQVSSASISPSQTSPQDYQAKWSTYYGYYLEPTPVQYLIDRKAIWTVGKGFKAEGSAQKRLSKIKGMGKDTFNTIMANAVKTYTIGGDFFAEIIQTKRKELVNLKPLNPGSIVIRANSKGIIKKYDQVEHENPSVPIRSNVLQSFKPDEIFHLAYNRTADEIHGVGVIQKIQDHILKYKEAINDLQLVFHRYVKPLIISSVDTDDAAEIADYKQKLDKAVDKGENMVVPKGVLDDMDRMSVPQHSTLDPLPWINYIEKQFIMAEGVPQVVLGSGDESTEASAKIMYLGWQQVIEYNQMFLEQQLEAQLGIKVEFDFPADIAPEIQQDIAKRRDMNNFAGGNQ